MSEESPTLGVIPQGISKRDVAGAPERNALGDVRVGVCTRAHRPPPTTVDHEVAGVVTVEVTAQRDVLGAAERDALGNVRVGVRTRAHRPLPTTVDHKVADAIPVEVTDQRDVVGATKLEALH